MANPSADSPVFEGRADRPLAGIAFMAAGVKIALYQPHFIHAKHLSVDDSVALISSINLDIRSFALNAEIGLLCYDAGVVAWFDAEVERTRGELRRLQSEIFASNYWPV